MRPNGGWSSSGTQNMQSSTGQYSTQAGDPAQPVQHSVITASSLGFFLRAVTMPFERGSNFCSSGTIPGALTASGAFAISRDSTFPVKPLSAWFLPPLPPSRACYNARAIGFVFGRTHVYQDFRQTPRAGFAGRTCLAPLLHPAFPFLFRRYGLLRRTRAQLAVPRRLWLLFSWAARSFGCARPRLSRVSRRDLFSGWNRTSSSHARASLPRSCHARAGRGHRQSFGLWRSRRYAHPCRRRCALANGSLSIHGKLCRSAAHGGSGNFFHHAGSSDFSFAGGNDHRPHRLEPRFAPRHKNLARGRTRCWPRHTGSPGNAIASRSRFDFPVGSLSPSHELEKTLARNTVDDRLFVAP